MRQTRRSHRNCHLSLASSRVGILEGHLRYDFQYTVIFNMTWAVAMFTQHLL